MKRTYLFFATIFIGLFGLTTGCAKLPELKPVDYPVATSPTAIQIEKYRLGDAVDLETNVCNITETSAVPDCLARRFHNMSWMAHGQKVGRARVQNVLNGHGDSFVISFECFKGRPETVFDDVGFRGSCRIDKQTDATPLFQIGKDDAVYEERHDGPDGKTYYQFGTR